MASTIKTSAQASRLARRLLQEAGVEATVNTPPASHSSNRTHVFLNDPEDNLAVAGTFELAGYSGVQFSDSSLSVQLIGVSA